MADTILVSAIALMLAILYLFYLFSAGSRELDVLLSVSPEGAEGTPAAFDGQAMQDPFSFRSYAGFGLVLVPTVVGILFLILWLIRLVRLCEKLRRTPGQEASGTEHKEKQ